MLKKVKNFKIRVEIINVQGKRSIFDFINVVLPTRLNSSPRILQNHRWFLQTFTSRFIELPSRDRQIYSKTRVYTKPRFNFFEIPALVLKKVK